MASLRALLLLAAAAQVQGVAIRGAAEPVAGEDVFFAIDTRCLHSCVQGSRANLERSFKNFGETAKCHGLKDSTIQQGTCEQHWGKKPITCTDVMATMAKAGQKGWPEVQECFKSRGDIFKHLMSTIR